MANEPKKRSYTYLTAGIIVGFVFGAVLGLIFQPNSFAIWAGMGLLLGTAVGIMIDSLKNSND